MNKGQPRKLDDWGASRAMDYFETDSDVDETRVVIEGLSRYGKAALVALAYEPRIAIGFIGSSGAGGAKILRRNLGGTGRKPGFFRRVSLVYTEFY